MGKTILKVSLFTWSLLTSGFCDSLPFNWVLNLGSGKISVTGTVSESYVSANWEALNVSLGSIQELTGHGKISLKGSLSDYPQGISGSFSLNINKCIVKDTPDLDRIVAYLKDKKSSMLEFPKLLKTKAPLLVTLISGDFAINQGIANTCNLLINTKNTVSRLHGTINLCESSIDLKGYTDVPALQWNKIQTSVSGPLKKPKITVDEQKLLSLALHQSKDKIQDAIGQFFNKVKSTVKF